MSEMVMARTFVVARHLSLAHVPALMQANVAIALGHGTDIAIESTDTIALLAPPPP